MSLLERPRATSGRTLPQLDALRGVAILAVFAQHLGDRFRPLVERDLARTLPDVVAPFALALVRHAWWGVDLFFVLSGFSLALGYLAAFERGGAAPSAARFYLRRAARILPAFFVALAVVVATHPSVVLAPSFPAALAAHLTLLQGYVAPGGIVLIGAAWSLTTEAHFYVAMPLLARPVLGGRRGIAVALAIVAAAWIVRAALHAIVLHPGQVTALLESTQRHWIVSRLDQFVLGMVAAAVYVRARGRGARLAAVGLVASTALLVVAVRLEGELYLTRGGSWPYALLSVATALLVLSASLADGRLARLVAPRALCAVGVVSYGAFLYHQLALELAHRLVPGEPTWGRLLAVTALALPASLLLAALSWVLVERPMMRRASVSATRAGAPDARTGWPRGSRPTRTLRGNRPSGA